MQGCHRSCIQHFLERECGCGDPRYPPASARYQNCAANNASLRMSHIVQPCVVHYFTGECSLFPVQIYPLFQPYIRGLPKILISLQQAFRYSRNIRTGNGVSLCVRGGLRKTATNWVACVCNHVTKPCTVVFGKYKHFRLCVFVWSIQAD
jgi:hypothetical protein